MVPVPLVKLVLSIVAMVPTPLVNKFVFIIVGKVPIPPELISKLLDNILPETSSLDEGCVDPIPTLVLLIKTKPVPSASISIFLLLLEVIILLLKSDLNLSPL